MSNSNIIYTISLGSVSPNTGRCSRFKYDIFDVFKDCYIYFCNQSGKDYGKSRFNFIAVIGSDEVFNLEELQPFEIVDNDTGRKTGGIARGELYIFDKCKCTYDDLFELARSHDWLSKDFTGKVSLYKDLLARVYVCKGAQSYKFSERSNFSRLMKMNFGSNTWTILAPLDENHVVDVDDPLSGIYRNDEFESVSDYKLSKFYNYTTFDNLTHDEAKKIWDLLIKYKNKDLDDIKEIDELLKSARN